MSGDDFIGMTNRKRQALDPSFGGGLDADDATRAEAERRLQESMKRLEEIVGDNVKERFERIIEERKSDEV